MLSLFAILTIAAALVWLASSSRSPLWRILAARPRTLDAADLEPRFDGFLRFGLADSYLSFQQRPSGHRILFSKGEGSQVMLRISGGELPDEIDDRLIEHASVTGIDLECTAHAHFHLRSPDSGRLESLTRAAVRALGHGPGCRYSIEFEGPADWEAVNEYFDLP